MKRTQAAEIIASTIEKNMELLSAEYLNEGVSTEASAFTANIIIAKLAAAGNPIDNESKAERAPKKAKKKASKPAPKKPVKKKPAKKPTKKSSKKKHGKK